MNPTEKAMLLVITSMFFGSVFMATVGRWLITKAINRAIGRGLNW
jgi:hypothetical protein